MPGFNVQGGGGDQVKNAKVESRRKHRWKFECPTPIGRKSVYLSSAQRPHAIIDEAIMHHDEEQAAFAGKYHWDPISLVFYDVVGDVDMCALIYQWFNTVINVPNANVATPASYKQTSKLQMTDGQGAAVETWNLYNSWPIDVNWNDLDYSNSEIQTVDVSLKFDRAQKE